MSALTPKELARLIDVLDAGFQAEQARMAEVGRRIDEIKARLDDLRRPQQPVPDGVAPAAWAEADIRWRAWSEERRKRLNQTLAGLLREREERRGRLALAFGKLQAAQAMRKQLLEDMARKRRRG